MLTINDKNYRNLQETVLYLLNKVENLEEAGGVLNTFGIKVIDQVATVEDMPTVEEYIQSQEALGRELEELYGDAIAVGTQPPYTLYIFTRAFSGAEEPEWFNIGQFPLAGPQGAQGLQGPEGPAGERGSLWFGQQSNPVSGSQYKINDKYLNTSTGDVYNFVSNMWQLVGNIRGPQGVQGVPGVQGVQGVQGPIGPQGVQGPSGQSFIIAGILSNTSQLPIPTESNRHQAYLVGNDTDGYNLYVITGLTELLWFDAGKVEGVQGPQGPAGERGAQGPAGANGRDGDTIQSIETGNVQYNQDQTITPLILTTSNNRQYTFNIVAQRGPQGLVGSQGIQGPRGEQGPVGPQGPQGPEGIVDYSRVYTKTETDQIITEVQSSIQNNTNTINNRITEEVAQLLATDQGLAEEIAVKLEPASAAVREVTKGQWTGEKAFWLVGGGNRVEMSMDMPTTSERIITLYSGKKNYPLATVNSETSGFVQEEEYIPAAIDLPFRANDYIDITAVRNITTEQNHIQIQLTDYAKDKIDTAMSKAAVTQLVNEKVSTAFQTKFVTTLPSTGEANTIYFKRVADGYEEYMWVNGIWELLGSSQVDLDNYYTKEQVNSELSGIRNDTSYAIQQATTAVNKANDVSDALTDKLDKSIVGNVIYCTPSSFHNYDTIGYSNAAGINMVPVTNSRGDLMLNPGWATTNKETFETRYGTAYEIKDTVLVTYGLLTDMLDGFTPSDVPTKTSDLTNDSGFITNTVDTLTNYYNKTEIDQKFAELPEPAPAVTFADSETIVVSDTETGAKQFSLKADLVNDISRSMKEPLTTNTKLRAVVIDANATTQGFRTVEASDGVTLTDNGSGLVFKLDSSYVQQSMSTLNRTDFKNGEQRVITGVSSITGMKTDSNGQACTLIVKTASSVTCNLPNYYDCKGDDCSEGIFTPQPNTNYLIYLYNVPGAISKNCLCLIMKVV